MAEQISTRRVWRWTPAVLLFAFAISLAFLGGAASARPANVHRSVYEWAQDHPGQDIPVVIDATGDTGAAAATVVGAGGQVKRELGIISSVQATVPPESVSALAASGTINWMTLDAPIVSANSGSGSGSAGSNPSVYQQTVKAPEAWADGYDGQGVGVAVVDTGVSPTSFVDFTTNGVSRVVANVVVNDGSVTTTDGYGHGTHIAGIIGGDGDASNGKYKGIAPGANIINVKISSDSGQSGMGDLIAGLMWIFEHRAEYNIRVVNLSLHSSVPESYKTSPLAATVEFLWKNDIFVVVAAGNTGPSLNGMRLPPANDPFVMTVGATDDRGTTSTNDDYPPSWSSFGFTQDGFFKPEMLAPGTNIISASDPNSILYHQNPSKVVNTNYLKLSGTSMSAGVMSGVAALVLDAHPNWKPGEVKCTLIAKGRNLSGIYFLWRMPRAADTIDRNSPSCNSDTGITPNRLLGGIPIIPMMGAVAWVLDQPDPQAAAVEAGLNLEEANIPPGATLLTVDWSAIKWDAIKWDVIKWDVIKWDVIKWDAIKWDAIKWDAIKWDVIKWDAIKWDAIKWDAIKWDAIKWDAIKWDTVDFDSVAEDFADTGEAPPPDYSEDLENVDETVVEDPTAAESAPAPPPPAETAPQVEPSN